MSDHYYRQIGELPPTLQGIALDLKIGEQVAITTDEHYSESHGAHYDIYIMKRTSESGIYLWKEHSTDTADKVVNQPLSSDDVKPFNPGPC